MVDQVEDLVPGEIVPSLRELVVEGALNEGVDTEHVAGNVEHHKHRGHDDEHARGTVLITPTTGGFLGGVAGGVAVERGSHSVVAVVGSGAVLFLCRCTGVVMKAYVHGPSRGQGRSDAAYPGRASFVLQAVYRHTVVQLTHERTTFPLHAHDPHDDTYIQNDDEAARNDEGNCGVYGCNGCQHVIVARKRHTERDGVQVRHPRSPRSEGVGE